MQKMGMGLWLLLYDLEIENAIKIDVLKATMGLCITIWIKTMTWMMQRMAMGLGLLLYDLEINVLRSKFAL